MYIKAALGMYISYFLLGMVNIILISNMTSLTGQWNTDSAGISYIISAIGIGKLLTYALSGRLSDKFGRKPLVIFGSFGLAIFLAGIPLAPSYQIAFALAFLAGVSNSALDAGAYPGLVEIFPKSAGSASVMVKAFMAVGTGLLPIMISFIASKEMFYGYAFFVPAVIYFLNTLFLFTVFFPNHRTVQTPEVDQDNGSTKFLSEPNFKKEGLALVVIGFTSTGLFTVAQIWLPSFGQQVLGMTEVHSIKLLSYYSVGMFVSVLSLAVLLKKFLRPVTVLVIYPIITFISIVTILTIRSAEVVSVASFFVGFSTAGIFQLSIATITEIFWRKKGTVTGILATAGGLASVVMPLVTGMLSKTGNIKIIFIFDALLSVIGLVCALFVFFRYRKLVNGHGGKDFNKSAGKIIDKIS
ncbi:MFS transporter [Priestia abyssalis]|uniref:MFS transporter n=1 Tax=Priestia abyssalis TaxID=1221450 RepID=UPI0009951981|nr:MFS transporter [Priestia abyssalis]